MNTPDIDNHAPFRPSRRRLLQGAGLAGLGLAGGLALEAGPASAATAATSALPSPGESGIEHVVVLMMENRSFDHFLGWLPGADGRQSGLSYRDQKGVLQRTHHLTTYQGCDFADPDHSQEGGVRQFDNGRCDGWLKTPGDTDTFPIGYYTKGDLPFIANAAQTFTTCDRYFAAFLGPTYPNRFYLHSAQTDRSDGSTTISTLPTIWDRLAAAGVSHNYYFSDIPFTALWGTKHVDISQPYAKFLLDCKLGTLPAVSFLDPRFEDEGSGTSGDDHPHGDIRAGERFLADVYEAVTSSPNWAKTVFIINFDEWGGFYDHVAPGTAPDANPANTRRGFRVPAMVISPLARRKHIAHNVYDHTSVLKMIEWRWGLPALTPRDKAARNIAEVLDFRSAPKLTAPNWNVPTIVGAPCAPVGLSRLEEWAPVKALALAAGIGLDS